VHASLQPLLDRAFGLAPAVEANRAIAEARDAMGTAKPVSYEVLVGGAEALAVLAARLVPRLVYHLESLGARPPGWGEVFLSLFVGERLHFVRVAEAMPLLLAPLGLSGEEALARFGTGELRVAVQLATPPAPAAARPPLLLGTGPKGE
jgi:hypothetical protein